MFPSRLRYAPSKPRLTAFSFGDALILTALAALLYAGVRLAVHAPVAVSGTEVSLSLPALPWYALLSTLRMAAAYALSLLFGIAYGRAAARSASAERLMLPIVDVLQSVPILSFQAIVLVGLSVLLPERFAAEFAAIVLIFTSQAWNLTYSCYQSQTQIPAEMREAAAIFRLSPWLRFKAVELPFAAHGLIWNSIMSWAGGWFFLMAAEMFSVGDRNYRLPGLGSYLQSASEAGDVTALLGGALTLVLVVVLLDQFVWRPLLAWGAKFKVDMVEDDEAPASWFLPVLSRSRLARAFVRRVVEPLVECQDQRAARAATTRGIAFLDRSGAARWSTRARLVCTLLGLTAVYGAARAVALLTQVQATAWIDIGVSLLATIARVAAALGLALLWTVPAGVAIGSSKRLTRLLQPIVEIAASVPATALFPMLLLVLIRMPGGLNASAIFLMLLGTQWYLLFNVIAGASSIPSELRQTSQLLRLSRRQRWRALYLPAVFPYLVTGAITASGGAWNASIVAEHVAYAGHTYSTVGIGALIAQANAARDYPLLLGATLALVASVVTINRLVWAPLYRLAESRYKLE